MQLGQYPATYIVSVEGGTTAKLQSYKAALRPRPGGAACGLKPSCIISSNASTNIEWNSVGANLAAAPGGETHESCASSLPHYSAQQDMSECWDHYWEPCVRVAPTTVNMTFGNCMQVILVPVGRSSAK